LEVGSQEKDFVPRVGSPDQIRSIFPQFRDFPQLSNFLQKKKKNNDSIALKSTLEHSPKLPRRTGNPKKKRKTDQRSSSKFNLREFIHLLSSR
jgi:hypothetical protein